MIFVRLKNVVRDALFSSGLYRPVKRAIKRLKTPRNRQKAIRYAPEILERVRSVFEERAAQYWLDYGTLLGYERHRGILPGDDDMDFGLYIRDGHSVSEHMAQRGMELIKQVLVEGRPALEQYRYRGFRFDLFYYRKCADGYVTYIWLPEHYEMPQPYAYEQGLATLSEIRFAPFRTRPILFYDVPFCVPEDIGSYLTQHYGADYRVPREDFGYDDELNRRIIQREHKVIFYA